MTVVFTDEAFRLRVQSDKRKFVIAAGQVGVNQAVDLSHVDTGLSRNAKYFTTEFKTSDFGNLPGKGGVERPPESLKEAPPSDDGQVVIYAPLTYDVPLETLFGTLERSQKLSRPLWNILITKIFK